jgi:HK97 family phage prohead protease
MAKVDNSAWNASTAWSNGADSDDPASFYKGICAGEKTAGDPGDQAHWALPHHYHPGDPPNAAGVRNALARISQTQGLKSKNAAQSHLDSHMTAIQAEEKAASGRADIAQARREQRQRGEMPGGERRVKSFPGKLQARLVDRGGKQFYHVDGFATVFERGYPMWDLFGEYTEVMDSTSLTRSLMGNPDVAWLVNHRGVTMARTTNGTLQLSLQTTPDGYNGLHADAYLNPDRQDVRDIVSAIVDGLVDEMSFAFMLEDGQWNDDYTEFRITQAEINRGDVSAVNYGANPFTSIQARTADILADLEKIPAAALGRAQHTVAKRILSSAAVDLSHRSAERYTRAAADLENIVRSVGYDGNLDVRDFDVSLDTPDPGDDAGSLAKAVDANLDSAASLLTNVDVSQLPDEVQQALDLMNGAGANIDQLLSVMNLDDPDDNDERSRPTMQTRDVKQRLQAADARTDDDDEAEPPLVIPPTGVGKSLKLWQSLGNQERLNEISRL